MNDERSLLGRYGEDRITGFRGRITGVVTYLSGCVQVLLAPKVGEDNKLPDGHFFDIQRIKVDDTVVRMTLDNAATPGFDKLPPSRTNI
jgi:hypothetical protein